MGTHIQLYASNDFVPRVLRCANASPGARLSVFVCAVLFFFSVSTALAVAPTQATLVGDTVTNPATGLDVVVVELMMDPVDSGAVPLELAYVRTSDDYLILVKNQVDDLLYTYDANGAIVQLTVVSTDPTTGTAQLRPTADPAAATSLIDYGSPWSGGSAGASAQNTSQTSPTGVRVVKVGAGGSNGAWGTLFIPPQAGGVGGTGGAVTDTNTTAVNTNDKIGFEAGSIGGAGGKGGASYASFWSGQPGGDGGKGGGVNVTNSVGADITTSGTAKYGIFAYSRSGKAGAGGSGYVWSGSGAGGHGSDGGAVTVSNNAGIRTTGIDAHGLYGLSVSGNGGSSGNSWGIVGSTANGSIGGNGGNVSLHNSGLIWTTGTGAQGIFGQSIGGTGGDSGWAGGIVATGGSGTAGGNGADVSITNAGVIRTEGDKARGIFAQSIGGGGGSGGGYGGLIALSGSGSAGGSGGTATVSNQTGGAITTLGNASDAIFVQSIGGGGGSGGGSGGLLATGGAGGASGNGGSLSVTNAAALRTFGNNARGIFAQSVGGGGGSGGGSGGLVALGSHGGGSGIGGSVTVNNQLGGDITTQGERSVAIFAQSVGGGGGSSWGSGGLVGISGSGGGSGQGGTVHVTSAGNLQTVGDKARGIFAQSVGGGGGSGGGAGGLLALSGSGSGGGNGGNVSVANSGSINTGEAGQLTKSEADAIFAQSVGGGGGNGSGTGGLVGVSGAGGGSGNGGSVGVTNDGGLDTYFNDSRGVFAQSIGGGGGSGGGSGGLVALSGHGSAGGNGGAVSVTNNVGGDITTHGARSDAIFVQSIGGGGGVGSGSGGVVTLGGVGSNGGSAGNVSVQNDGKLNTSGASARGIFAQSIGGGGGVGGGSGGLVAIGGSSTAGSNAGEVAVISRGDIATTGEMATAVYAQSIGGGGGSGASSGGPLAIGGSGTGGGKGGAVTVSTTGKIQTSGYKSFGVFAQSVGGGGGDGGTAGGVITIGGSAGTGNNGGKVSVSHGGEIATEGEEAAGIFAQSIGGGGGNGGGAYSGSVIVGLSLGGSGAAGGLGGDVEVKLDSLMAGGSNTPAVLSTNGNHSTGIMAQSVGGGGGNGGNSVQVSQGVLAVAIGGSGGAGGLGGSVNLSGKGKLTTRGNNASAVVLQSVGGGGGNGGTTVAAAFATGDGLSVSVAVGGSGGSGGFGGEVTSNVEGEIKTTGESSTGFLAQSVGGGGGNGSTTVAGSGGGGAVLNGEVSVAVGGSGGSGGLGGRVDVSMKGSVVTLGNQSDAVVVQSIGGGGGNGGIAVSGSGGVALMGLSVPISVGVGGSGGSGGAAGIVTTKIESDVDTTGDGSDGVVIQSVGGGGGNGGLTVAASGSVAGGFAISVNVGVGGTGGSGGDGNLVEAESTGKLITRGDNSTGLLAQSVGGGGGNAGGTVAAGLNGAVGGGGNVNVGVGGSGGAAGDGGVVMLDTLGSIETFGTKSSGMLAQSIGGGGGNGGFSVAGGLGVGVFGSAEISASIGGFGAGGGAGDLVVANAKNTITTHGDDSVGLLAQSVGGGGGNGAFSVSTGVAGAIFGAGAVNFSLGGFGDFSGAAGTVEATAEKNISTLGKNSTGFIAQSIGGGGGNGGFSVAGNGALAFFGNGTGSLGIGGGGAGGGNGAAVIAAVKGDVSTLGNSAGGILAQSIGGGGGNGGFNVELAGSAAWYGTGAVGVGVGGFSDGGGHGSSVALTVGSDDPSITSKVFTQGDDSVGLLAQSVGGGGGNGGFNVSLSASVAGYGNGAGGVGVGGGGGGGGNAADVTTNVRADIDTRGDNSIGLLAQSVGGGGGNGGFNVTVSGAGSGVGSGGAVVGVGGLAGGGGTAGKVNSTLTGDVTTSGDKATAVIAQSVGGGGGNGAFPLAGFITGAKTGSGGASISVGGVGGGGGTADTVINSVTGDIVTYGDDSGGVLVQSVGGGGGNGAFSLSGTVALAGTGSGALSVGVGGVGGGGGVSANVTNTLSGTISTGGENSIGVAAQSIGGGGGNGGFNVAGALTAAKTGTGALAVGVGGVEGGGGNAANVNNTVTGYVQTLGKSSTGILSQSVGGGGGNGGVNVTGIFTGAKTGSGNVAIGVGGFGGNGGSAGLATSSVTGGAVTTGDESTAILTQSVGGGGGSGSVNVSAGINFTMNYGGTGGFGLGGFGGGGGDAAAVSSTVKTTTAYSQIGTTGDNASAIVAQSVGGGGGSGGVNVGAGINVTAKTGLAVGLGVGGFGGGGGNAGKVTLDATGQVVTEGNNSSGLIAQSIGGGGNGGVNVAGTLAFVYKKTDNQAALATSIGVGGFAGGGGNGSAVDVKFNGTIVAQPRTLVPATSDTDSGAIIAAHYAYNEGEGSNGLLAQSIGGGGGNGGINVSSGLSVGIGKSDGHALFVGVGGFGGGGGNAGDVTVTASGNGTTDTISSYGDGYSAIAAQSIGGGGGNGTLNVSGGLVTDSPISIGVGGIAGTAGTGGDVKVSSTSKIYAASGDIEPLSDWEIERQSLVDSVRGAISELTSDDPNIKAVVDAIVGVVVGKTEPEHSAGIMAQSIGGGGGNGGVNVSGGLSIRKEKLPSVTFGIGGFGGAGSVSGDVTVSQTGHTDTVGDWTHGIFAQSVAGGGGNGGFNSSGEINFGDSSDSGGSYDFTGVIGIGGLGGFGADAGDVSVKNSGAIGTVGDYSRGLFAQSIGGGGGNGGMNVTTLFAVNSSPISVGIGGSGLGGGDGGNVTVSRGSATVNAGSISTVGQGAIGIEASSIGGGGGDAGLNFQLGLSLPNSDSKDQSLCLGVAIGGWGAMAGNAGMVNVDNYSDISTFGNNSYGILGQSIGGGGGNASINLALAFTKLNIFSANSNSKGLNVAIGGGSAAGGVGGQVEVSNNGNLETWGWGSTGILAQSIGGGGGNSSMNTAFGQENGKIGISIGGSGSNGAIGGDVTLTSKGQVRTHGENAYGLMAQSIGGGGGNSGTISISVVKPENKDKKTPAMGFGIGIGLLGGVGSTGGDVTVNAEGVIATGGNDADAIVAQSIGGGGGNGGGVGGMGTFGSTTGAVAIGGIGGKGGAGGDVTVNSSATISTAKSGSVGILAQSVGGGGGNGGSAGGTSLYSKTSSVRVTVGGVGGEGTNAGTVKVTNTGTISTGGRESYGVLAQSIGGGGGNGGKVTNEVVYETGGKDEPRYHVKVGIGGFGGVGGVGGKVELENKGTITTAKDDAIGLFAQSIGGGGGNGSTVIAGSLMGVAGNNLNLSVGGVGGLGGVGGEVNVKNLKDDAGDAASIVTRGDNAYGILAMSVGGGGGNGGTSVTTSGAGFSTPGGKTTYTADVSIGGVGGIGGTGGKTVVENAGNITTYGENAHGIIAQSIGGGGGNGGLAISGDLSLGATGKSDAKQHVSTIALGGVGGFGNNAGDIVVKNSGTITVNGDNANGVYAQSVGGGGGNGGFAIALSRNLLTNPFQVGVLEGALLNIGVGGVGSFGGSGGKVTVEHTGTITANGDNAYGIFAQSVAGGGGNMGYSLSSPVWMAAGLGVNLGLGAVRDVIDEVTDTSATVTVHTTGDIIMNGNNSHAYLAQSVHGGGGNIDLFMDVSKQAVEIGEDGIERPSNDPMLSNFTAHLLAPIKVGAHLAWKEAGGDLFVEHAGEMLNFGSTIVSYLAQSIGGGGGSTTVNPIIAKGTKFGLDLLAGAEETFGSDGGNVSARTEGGIYTTNAQAQGVSYQSIGGGGGHIIVNVKTVPPDEAVGVAPVAAVVTLAAAPQALDPPLVTASVALGAVASTDNHGGNLDITNNGDILTQGAYSPGLILQSIGAGGADVHLYGLETLDVTIGGQEGSSGTGGNIHFTNTGVIATDGERSHGLILQSIGGGGAAVFTDLASGMIDLTLSSANSGNGGDIDFTQQGSIQVSGDEAYGVLAQSIGGGGGLVDTLFAGSAGGSGSGGTITLNLANDVIASGADSTAIFAQSVGGDGSGGDIALSLNGEVVIGGSGTGSGVRFDGGASNSLSNHANLLTMDGIAGMVIQGTSGSEQIDNFATVIGNVNLGGGSNVFRNHPESWFLPGAQVSLGIGNRLDNAGFLSPGDLGTLQTTALDGDFEQSTSGTLLVDLDFSGNLADRIVASGLAEVAGQVDLYPLHPDALLPGNHQVLILTGDAGLSNNATELLVPSSAVVDYQLFQPNANSLVVGLDIDFSPTGLNSNLTAIGDYFNRIQLAGGSQTMAPVVTDIFSQPDSASLAPVYAAMNPVENDYLTEVTLNVTRQSNRILLARLQELSLARKASSKFKQSASIFKRNKKVFLAYAGSDSGFAQLFDSRPPEDNMDGVWVNLSGQTGRQRQDDQFEGYDFTSQALSAGFDRLIGSNFMAGWSLGYAHTSLNVDDQVGNGSVDSIHGALYGRYFTKKLYVDGVLSYGRQDYENERQTQVLGVKRIASSQHNGGTLSVYGETGYNLTMSDWRLQPFAALNYVFVDEDGFSETGADPLNLTIHSRTTESLIGDAGGRFFRVYTVATGVVIPVISVSYNHDFGIDNRQITTGFSGYQGTTFSVKGRDSKQSSLHAGFGLNFLSSDGFSSSLKYHGEFNNGYRSSAVMGQVRIEF